MVKRTSKETHQGVSGLSITMGRYMREKQTMVGSMVGVVCLNTTVIAVLVTGKTVYFTEIPAFMMKKIKLERKDGSTMVNTLLLSKRVLPSSNIGIKQIQLKALSTFYPKSNELGCKIIC